jgi:RNA polymerase sigma factor (sigma-70 family)
MSHSAEAALRQGACKGNSGGAWSQRSERWGELMADARGGDDQSHDQLLRELDAWLRRYYARRLSPPAADDARQEVLLAVHAKRHVYTPSGPFGAWLVAIARHKLVDRIRDEIRHAAVPLEDDIAIEDHGTFVTSAAALDDLLSRLKPAQENAIRLVKLQGFSVAQASQHTGQSASLVKVNVHRGLKKLAALIT